MTMLKQIIKWGSRCVVCCALALQGCALNNTAVDQPVEASREQITEADTLIPKGALSTNDLNKSFPITYGDQLSDLEKDRTRGEAVALKPIVWLYASPNSKKYHEKTGLNFQVNLRVWELFLSKYHIPFKIVSNLEKIETSETGVLVLPSQVALSNREKQAILNFRALGGSVLSTWLTGVLDENNRWLGFSFMENGLNAKVLGDTQADEEENFLMAYGDSPVLHSLMAGQRIWLERRKGLYPIRLQGQRAAAQIMDWSRSSAGNKVNTLMIFGEHRQASGVLSRAISLGYSEHLWLSADPAAMEAIAHNALTWLARQPIARVASWPHPYTSAASIVVDAPEVVDDLDVNFGELVTQMGGKATFYVPSINAVKSAPALRKLQSAGHDIAYMSDRFEGFKGQTTAQQAVRLEAMKKDFDLAKLSTKPILGFNAPMGSQDQTTQNWLNQSGFSYFVGSMSETESRVPVLIPRKPEAAGTSKPMVMLPRTQNGPEDLMNDGNPDEGLQKYLSEFESAFAMGGLMLIRFPNQTLLTDDQLATVFEQIKKNSSKLWLASNHAIAQWWLDRSRVRVTVERVNNSLLLVATVEGTSPMSLAPSVTVNLPYANDILTLIPIEQPNISPSIVALDPWRAAISLGNLKPGTHRWHMHFQRTPLIFK